MLYSTGNIPNLKHLIVSSIFALTSLFSIAQTKPEYVTVDNAILFSQDRYNNIYYITETQDVKKWSDQKLIYSSPKRKKITHIEAWNTAKIFLFSREFQEYTILDRYLTELSTKTFNMDEVGFADFATMALDGNIWLIDNTNFSLKKISISTNTTMLTTNLNLIIPQVENEVIFMKEYGNFLYVCTQHNGILVFDNLGTYKKKISYDGVAFLAFKDDVMYFTQNNETIYFDLLKLSEKRLPSRETDRCVVELNNQQYIIKK